MKKIDWLVAKFDKINDYLGVIAGGIVLFIIGIMFYEVIMRYVFNAPTKFALELSMISQQVFVGVAAAYVLKIEGHVSLEIFTDGLPRSWQNWLLFITSIFSAIVCGFMVYQMVKVTAWSRKIGELTSLLEFPVYPFKLILTIGLALFGIGFITRSYKSYRRIRGDADKKGA